MIYTPSPEQFLAADHQSHAMVPQARKEPLSDIQLINGKVHQVLTLEYYTGVAPIIRYMSASVLDTIMAGNVTRWFGTCTAYFISQNRV